MRSFLAGLFALLACLLIVVSTTLTWTHSVALDTDHYVELVGNVAAEPEVTDTIADRLATRLVTQLQVEQRLQSILPDRLDAFAGTVTTAITARLRDRLATALASPGFQSAWETANRGLHTLVVRVLRGDSTVVTTQDGYLTINLIPLIGVALQQLQEIGIIPADVVLPDLSSGQLPPDFGSRLQAVGITIPPDFGTLPVMSAPRLVKLQGFVAAFDVIIVVVWVLSAIFAGLALFLARRRVRMALLVAFGTIIGFIVLGLVINVVRDAVTEQVTTPDGAAAVDAILDILIADLFSSDRFVILAAATIGVLVFLLGRWAVRDRSAGGAVAATWARANGFDILLAIGGLVVTLVVAATTTLGWAAFAAALLMLFLLARLALRPVDRPPTIETGDPLPVEAAGGGA
jgi:hypothetical protein